MFQELINALRDVQSRHAILVHLPIALSVLGVPLVLALAATKARNRTLHVVCLAAYATLLASAVVAARSGEAAAGTIGRPDDEVIERVQQHEWLAEKVWLGAAVTLLALLGLSFTSREPNQVHAAGGSPPSRPRLGLVGALNLFLVCVAAVGQAALTGLAAHHGGTLVYAHGVGIPRGEESGDAALPTASQPAGGDPRIAHFLAAVRPLLDNRCFGCHGGGRRIGGELRLATMGDILKGGEHGPALVPGDPEASLIIKVVTDQHESVKVPQMPLNNDPLTPEEVDALRRWIREGAVWR